MAASGIGSALCRRFAAEGARGVVVADRNESAARAVAAEIGGLAVCTDVERRRRIWCSLVEQATAAFGPIDLFCSNAGIATEGGVEAADADWQRIWQVNLMAHVYAARAVLPGMLARGEGYLLQTASAAGLLTQIGSAPYSVTKHAAVGFGGMAGDYLSRDAASRSRASVPRESAPRCCAKLREESAIFCEKPPWSRKLVADAVIAGLADERFLILPHPEVAEYFQHKADDYDRWLRGMRRLQDRLGAGP